MRAGLTWIEFKSVSEEIYWNLTSNPTHGASSKSRWRHEGKVAQGCKLDWSGCIWLIHYFYFITFQAERSRCLSASQKPPLGLLTSTCSPVRSVPVRHERVLLKSRGNHFTGDVSRSVTLTECWSLSILPVPSLLQYKVGTRSAVFADQQSHTLYIMHSLISFIWLTMWAYIIIFHS